MPYIITTRETRRAVATLDEARGAVWRIITDADIDDRPGTRRTWATVEREKAMALPAAGGTVGPLPDGTVIEVEWVDWFDVAKVAVDGLDRAFVNAMAADLPESYPGVSKRLIDAYNTQED
jgi:hypothetical protein